MTGVTVFDSSLIYFADSRGALSASSLCQMHDKPKDNVDTLSMFPFVKRPASHPQEALLRGSEGLKVGWPFVAKLFVGGFHYRNKTLTKVGCMFVLFHLFPCGTCGVCVCFCVCESLSGDDILIFVKFRLEATVSQSPVVKGRNKKTCTSPVRARKHRLHAQARRTELHTTVSTASAARFLLGQPY